MWKLLENGGDQLITFVISVILARLLGPEKYGTMAVMLIFVAIGNVIIQTGFQTALIQKEEVDDTDLSSVFWLGLFLAALLYALLFLCAPRCAAFFADAEITPMLRALGLILFFGSVVSLETAVIARRMAFRKQCAATVLAELLSGAAGVIAAGLGAGTWALVLQQLGKQLLLMLFLFRMVGWRPAACFSLSRISVLFSYGWKVLASGLIDTVWNNLYTPVISKLYHPLYTGYYSRANQFPQVIGNAAAQTIQAVMLPAFSAAQRDETRLAGMLRSTVRMGSFLMFPMMFGLAAVSEPLIRLLLGEAWRGAAPYLAICALGYSVWPMHIANLQAINARGRSDLYLKLELVKKLLGLLVLLLSIRFGIFMMILLKSLTDFVCTLINAWPNRRLPGCAPLAQWREILPSFLAALLMGVLVFCLPVGLGALCARWPGGGGTLEGVLSGTGAGAALCLLLQIAAGILIYGGLALALRMESLQTLLQWMGKLWKKS